MHEVLPIYNPFFVEIRWKIREKWYTTNLKLLNRHFLFCVLVTLTFDLCTSKCIQLFYMSLSIDRLNLRRIGQKTPEKSCNASRTNFQRLSPLDLCPMTLQMHKYTVFTNVYTPAKFHQDRMKNDREIATYGFSILCPWPLTFAPQKVYSSSTSHYLSSGKIWERSDNKWQRNRVTQVAVKKKNTMKKK